MDLGLQRLQVDRFIAEQIDSVPHLEALLLLFRTQPKQWSTEEISGALYVRNETAGKILENLLQRGLIASHSADPGVFYYDPANDAQNRMLEHVDTVYRREVVRISSMIHSKGSAGVRDFARAFRIKKD